MYTVVKSTGYCSIPFPFYWLVTSHWQWNNATRPALNCLTTSFQDRYCVKTVLLRMEPSSILSNVINMPMDVIYPAVYDSNDIAFKQLKMSIRRGDQLINDPIKTIRSSTFEPRPPKIWTPNHFVPVVPETSTIASSRPEIYLSFTSSGKGYVNAIYKKSQSKARKKEGRTQPSLQVTIYSLSPLPSSPNVPSLTKLKFLRYFIAYELII